MSDGGRTDSGKALGVDIFRLWQAGTDHLPGAADVFHRAGSTSDAGAPAFSAFAWSGRPDGSYIGAAGIAWLVLQADLTGLLSATGGNLDATAEALCLAASAYAATDRAASAEFERRRAAELARRPPA